jgi:hypothetical protein
MSRLKKSFFTLKGMNYSLGDVYNTTIWVPDLTFELKKYDPGYFHVENKKLGIHYVLAKTKLELKETLIDLIYFILERYVLEDNKKLSPDAIELKNNWKKIIGRTDE